MDLSVVMQSSNNSINWVKLLGKRKPGSPCRSKKVQDALDKPFEGFNPWAEAKEFVLPGKALMLAEKCNSLWRLYLSEGEYYMVIGETITDRTVGKQIARKEGNQIHIRRTIKHLHRNSMTYGISCMLVDYVHNSGRNLWINNVEHTLENFNSFNVLSQGGFELQYMVPRDLIRL